MFEWGSTYYHRHEFPTGIEPRMVKNSGDMLFLVGYKICIALLRNFTL
jgi:hypothetical protein